MKCICLLFLVIVAVWGEEKYTTENDDIDIESVVKNLETLKAFYNCFMDIADCDPVSADFKKDLQEVVETACAKCTDRQKHILNRFLDALAASLPKESADFKKKYDPNGKYFGSLKAAIANF